MRVPLGAAGLHINGDGLVSRGQRTACETARSIPVSIAVVVVKVLLVSSLSAMALEGSTVVVEVMEPAALGAVRCSRSCLVVPGPWPVLSWPGTVPPEQVTTLAASTVHVNPPEGVRLS